MRVLFTGEPWVHYGQIYVDSGRGLSGDLHESFAGQRNGLCGASVPGTLFLITGLHTGDVGFTVERHDERPPVDQEWDEIVEASFRPGSARVVLSQWGGEDSWDLDLPEREYRVRYCAAGMDQAHAVDTKADGEPLLDRYLLQFWPEDPAPDSVVKQTGETAAYWHGAVREFPSVEELAQRRHQVYLADERATLAEEYNRAERAAPGWGGRPPSDRLRAVQGSAQQLAVIDRDLVDAIADARPERQREIARTAVRLAYQGAGLTGIPWIELALAALERGDDLPAPFDDQTGVWNHLFGDPSVPDTLVPGTADHSRQAMALPAIFEATAPDPLRAALDTLWTARYSFGTDGHQVLDQIRGEH
jgi:hypothetical protein